MDAYLADAMSLGAEAFADRHPFPVLVIAEPSEEVRSKIRRPETLITSAVSEETADLDPSLAYMVGASLDALVLTIRPKRKEATEGVVIGRAPEVDVVLLDESVSREHARVVWDEARQTSMLEDLNARNGTFVDGRRLQSALPTVLVPGAAVRFGALSARYYTPRAFLAWLSTGAPRSGASPEPWPKR